MTIEKAIHFANIAQSELTSPCDICDYPQSARYYFLCAAKELGYSARLSFEVKKHVLGKKNTDFVTRFEIVKDGEYVNTADTTEEAQDKLIYLALLNAK